jgi:hypothetical protein
MRNSNLFRITILIVLVGFSPLLNAEDSRTIPLDMYLIIDGSQAFQNAKNDVITWANAQVVDRILAEGDSIAIWTAADASSLVYQSVVSSGISSGGKSAIKDTLTSLTANGQSADFAGALKDAAAMAFRAPDDRLSCTMLVTASAEGLGNALTEDSRNLFKWFRSERYERWQVLIVAPGIEPKVREAAASYMRSAR